MSVLPPLRVLHVNSEHGWRGGERQLLLLAEAQEIAGTRVMVVCQPGSILEGSLQKAGIPHIPVRMRGEWDLLASRAIAGLVKEWQPDLVHAHTAHAHALCWFSRLAMPFPLMVHRRVDFKPQENVFSRLKYFRNVDKYIAVSGAVARVLQGFGLPPNRIRVVHSGVRAPTTLSAVEKRRLRRDLGLGDTQGPIIGTVAALVPHKGLTVLVSAALPILQERPGAQLVIVGEGEDRPRLEALIAASGASSRIHLCGFRADASSLLTTFDLFVASSLEEGLNTSLIEAQLAGIPGVATSAGGLMEAAEDAFCWRAEVGSVASLQEAMSRALADPAGCRQKAMQGMSRAQRLFSVGRMCAETDSVYREVLEEGRTGRSRKLPLPW